jgi:17beta-estradiol 17-dehydrogenase / very-long-chain 3-oxoacyl-CoA reductase
VSLVVTGASDGIGREFAIQLARAGFNVLLAARNQAKLDSVVDDIGACLFCLRPFVLSHQSGMNIVNACRDGSGGVQTKTFVVDFASADEARWEALLEELKPIEVGVLGASVSSLLTK